MTLLDLYEPLFLKVCELNRMSRFGHSQDFLEVKSEIKSLLDEIAQRSSSDPKLAAQVKKLDLPIVCFVDSMVASGKLRFAADWHSSRLAQEKFNELAGDERFFDLLEETLNDPSDEASERLAVFHSCLGLGFVGSFTAQPEQLKKYMGTIGTRIKHLMDVDLKSRLCPEAYKSVDSRNLIEPPSNKMVFVLILFICASLSALLIYYAMYADATNSMNQHVNSILQKQK